MSSLQPLDERPLSQRDFEHMRGRHAITRDDQLVVIVEWERSSYWGAKVLRVRQASPGGHGMSWEEEDADLTPAFPEREGWLEDARRLRAEHQAQGLFRITIPARACRPRRRV